MSASEDPEAVAAAYDVLAGVDAAEIQRLAEADVRGEPLRSGGVLVLHAFDLVHGL